MRATHAPARVLPGRRFAIGSLAIVVLCTLVIGWGAERQLVNGSTLRSLVVALAAVSLPVLGLLAWRRPLIFPFCAYVALVPFDNLLATGVGDTLTKLLAIASAAALLLHLLIYRDSVLPARSLYAWGGLILWMGSTIVWAIEPTAAADQFVRYAQLFGLLCIVAVFPASMRDLRSILVVTVLGACAASLFGAYTFFNGTGNVDNRLYVTNGASHIDPNHFGASLLMPLALAIAFALRRAHIGWRAFGIVSTAILVAGIYFSESRGALVATGAMLAVFFIFSRHRFPLAIGVSLAACALPVTLIQRLQIAAQSGGNGRLDIWRSALAALQQYWLLGAGIGNFPQAYDSVYLRVTHEVFFSWHIQAHNLLAQSAVELGILGLALMLFAWFSQWRDARKLRLAPDLAELSIALQAGLVALFVSSLFLDIMWSKYTWLAFTLVAVACAAAAARERQARINGVET